MEAGSSGNVGAGTVHEQTACPVAVTAVTNEKAFRRGLSKETDEELRQRILDSFQRLPNGANAAWYELTACRHEGVALSLIHIWKRKRTHRSSKATARWR